MTVKKRLMFDAPRAPVQQGQSSSHPAFTFLSPNGAPLQAGTPVSPYTPLPSYDKYPNDFKSQETRMTPSTIILQNVTYESKVAEAIVNQSPIQIFVDTFILQGPTIQPLCTTPVIIDPAKNLIPLLQLVKDKSHENPEKVLEFRAFDVRIYTCRGTAITLTLEPQL